MNTSNLFTFQKFPLVYFHFYPFFLVGDRDTAKVYIELLRLLNSLHAALTDPDSPVKPRCFASFSGVTRRTAII